jgi:hypothetical protein
VEKFLEGAGWAGRKGMGKRGRRKGGRGEGKTETVLPSSLHGEDDEHVPT